jgi:RNA polymerase sigma factor (sigma-70 family)
VSTDHDLWERLRHRDPEALGELFTRYVQAVAARIDSERRIAAVHRALRRLPKHERETVELVYWAELSIAAAATVLGVAPGTVKARLSRARRRLPELLDDITHPMERS